MSACAVQVFPGVSEERFGRLAAKAASQKLILTGTGGTFTHSGAMFDWNFDSASQTLTVQCTKVPPFIGCGAINGIIHNLVDSCP